MKKNALENDATKNNIIYLDYSKWRCGSDSQYKLGVGCTTLLNDEGYMCCLGQASLQFGIKPEDMHNAVDPSDLDTKLPILNKKVKKSIRNTEFSYKAMQINDDTQITPLQKIKSLKSLFKKSGYRLIVKNQPK